jgi:hypothetical protein
MAKAAKGYRAFKSKGFAKTAKKAGISDADLCDALLQIFKGQCDDLGGGVFKKRLNKNEHRGIILAEGGNRWIYEFIFAKKDRENIDDDELKAFRKLAADYAKLTGAQMTGLIENGDLMEICDGE